MAYHLGLYCLLQISEIEIGNNHYHTDSPKSVRCFTRRNLFILNKFLISGKILITCRELYFEVGGHVYLIIMGYIPENEIFTV